MAKHGAPYNGNRRVCEGKLNTEAFLNYNPHSSSGQKRRRVTDNLYILVF
jgi:hypothetical protein